MVKSRAHLDRRGAAAAGSVVLGTAVGAVVNVLTSAWSWTVAAAGGIALVSWAVLEYRRAKGEPEPAAGPAATAPGAGGIEVAQDLGRVGGHVVGVSLADGSTSTGRAKVRQKAVEVAEGAEIVGYQELG